MWGPEQAVLFSVSLLSLVGVWEQGREEQEPGDFWKK